MGLQLVLTATDLLEYMQFPHDLSALLVTDEQLLALTGAYVAHGALWGMPNGRLYYFDGVNTNLGWCFRRWILDALEGAKPAQGDDSIFWDDDDAIVTTDYRHGATPSGIVYRWSATRDAEPVALDFWAGAGSRIGVTEGTWPWNYGGVDVTLASFGLGGTRCSDFAVDDQADRCWIRTPSMGGGQVECYQISDRSHVATLYAPNTTSHILPTGDGTVWLIDEYGWCVLYGYDGELQAAMRADLSVPDHGRIWGWDRAAKRLLTLPITEDTGTNVSSLRVSAYYPQPQPHYLSAPVARTQPRKVEEQRCLTHLCGAGGEPIAGRTVRAAALVALGLPQTDVQTDMDGDALIPIEPVSTGGQLLELEVLP